MCLQSPLYISLVLILPIQNQDVFSEVGSIEEKHFSEINKEDNSWAINIARNKTNLLDGMSISKRINFLTKPKEEISQLKEISHKIDDLKLQLKNISE